jgi:hypothetical protein
MLYSTIVQAGQRNKTLTRVFLPSASGEKINKESSFRAMNDICCGFEQEMMRDVARGIEKNRVKNET